MSYTKTKPAKQSIYMTRLLYELSGAGKTPAEPDYHGYTTAKRQLEKIPMTPEQYEAEIKILTEIYGL